MQDITRVAGLALDAPEIYRRERGGRLSRYPDIEKPAHAYTATRLIEPGEAREGRKKESRTRKEPRSPSKQKKQKPVHFPTQAGELSYRTLPARARFT